MRNVPAPDDYTVDPDARLETRHDTSELPISLMAALNTRVSSRFRDDPRSEEMAVEIADELLGGSSMYGKNRIPGLSDGSFTAVHQMVEHGWNRTFAERLEEVVRKYKGVSRDELRRELTEAWWNVQQIITRHDARS